MRLLLPIAFAAAALSAPVLAHDFMAGALTINHPVIREMLPSQKVAGGYITFVNSGSQDDRLVGIESDTAKSVELHRTVVENDIASMQAMIEGLSLPAGETTKLGEGGTHAMFVDPQERLVVGAKVAAVLIFEKAGRVPVVFNVEKLKANQVESHH